MKQKQHRKWQKIQLKIADIITDKLSKGQIVTIEGIKTELIGNGLASDVDTITGEIRTAKGHSITDLLDGYLGNHERETDGANAPQQTEGMTPVKWNLGDI